MSRRSTPEPFTLVGYSQGGRIALHVALALPAPGDAVWC